MIMNPIGGKLGACMHDSSMSSHLRKYIVCMIHFGFFFFLAQNLSSPLPVIDEKSQHLALTPSIEEPEWTDGGAMW